MSEWIELRPDGADALRNRFFDFGDSILQSVQLLVGDRNQRGAQISLMAHDRESVDDWVEVDFRITSLTSYRCDWPNERGKEVLQNEVCFVWGDGLVFLVVYPDVFYQAATLTVPQARQASFYFAGRRLDWRVGPMKNIGSI